MPLDERVVDSNGIVTHVRNSTKLEVLETYTAVCCREWDVPYGYAGRCGLCGEVPVKKVD